MTTTANLKGFDIKLKTRPGIFSSKGIDGGTALLIDQMQIQDNTLIADLGSGCGVIGLVAAHLNPHGHIHLLDDHLRAVELAKENVILNKLTNVEVYLSDLFSSIENRSYHQILSNPPQQLGNEFLEELIEKSFNHLKPQGELWLVVKKNVKPLITRLLEKRFGNCTIVAQGREHVLLKSQKIHG